MHRNTDWECILYVRKFCFIWFLVFSQYFIGIIFKHTKKLKKFVCKNAYMYYISEEINISLYLLYHISVCLYSSIHPSNHWFMHIIFWCISSKAINTVQPHKNLNMHVINQSSTFIYNAFLLLLLRYIFTYSWIHKPLVFFQFWQMHLIINFKRVWAHNKLFFLLFSQYLPKLVGWGQ